MADEDTLVFTATANATVPPVIARDADILTDAERKLHAKDVQTAKGLELKALRDLGCHQRLPRF